MWCCGRWLVVLCLCLCCSSFSLCFFYVFRRAVFNEQTFIVAHNGFPFPLIHTFCRFENTRHPRHVDCKYLMSTNTPYNWKLTLRSTTFDHLTILWFLYSILFCRLSFEKFTNFPFHLSLMKYYLFYISDECLMQRHQRMLWTRWRRGAAKMRLPKVEQEMANESVLKVCKRQCKSFLRSDCLK